MLLQPKAVKPQLQANLQVPQLLQGEEEELGEVQVEGEVQVQGEEEEQGEVQVEDWLISCLETTTEALLCLMCSTFGLVYV